MVVFLVVAAVMLGIWLLTALAKVTGGDPVAGPGGGSEGGCARARDGDGGRSGSGGGGDDGGGG